MTADVEERSCVVVTGASSGIGAAIATELARQGYVVACLSRRGTRPPDADRRLEPSLVPIQCDVSDEASRMQAVENARAMDAPITGLVNAAGFHTETPAAEISIDELRSVLETNLVGSIRMAQLLFPQLCDATHGFVVNIGSFFGRLGVPGFIAYAASKGGLEAVTRVLGVEWAPYGISVINVAPGYVETGLNAEFLTSDENRAKIARQIPAGRVASAEEIARLVGAIICARVSFLTAETIYVDGGQGVRL